jgi:hypothetical protein
MCDNLKGNDIRLIKAISNYVAAQSKKNPDRNATTFISGRRFKRSAH